MSKAENAKDKKSFLTMFRTRRQNKKVEDEGMTLPQDPLQGRRRPLTCLSPTLGSVSIEGDTYQIGQDIMLMRGETEAQGYEEIQKQHIGALNSIQQTLIVNL